MLLERSFEEDAPIEDAPITEAPPAGSLEDPAPASPAAPPAEPAESAVQRLEDQLREWQDRHLRLAAEFDNFRKRVTRERIELTDRAQAAFVIRLLEVLDDLDRLVALDSDGPQPPGDPLRVGVRLVDKKLRKELEAAGLERIDPAGTRFDPAVHEAVSVLPPPTPDQDHLVSATFQVGYRFKGALVRPARVQVYSSSGQEGNA